MQKLKTRGRNATAVVKEKNDLVDNQPYGTFLENILKELLRYSIPLGTNRKYAAFGRSKAGWFIKFYKTYYVPNNCVLSIAGDINVDDTKMIDQYFAGIPKRRMYTGLITEPPLGGEVRDIVEDNIQHYAVVEAYRAPAQGTDEYYAFGAEYYFIRRA
jgi:hypothetical protein